MPSGVNVPLTFEIYKVDPKGDTLVRKETLTQDIIKVGKLSSSHLRIDDESVYAAARTGLRACCDGAGEPGWRDRCGAVNLVTPG